MRLFNPDHIRDENDRRPGRLHPPPRQLQSPTIGRPSKSVSASNLQTAPDLKRVVDHSLGKMLENKLSITFCTDNRLVSHTDVTSEISLALDNFEISPSQLRNIIVYGFKRSFSYKRYPEETGVRTAGDRTTTSVWNGEYGIV
jgi:adenosine deaminase